MNIQYLTLAETAEYLGVSEKTVLNNLQLSGILRGIVLNSVIVFPCDRVERCANEMRNPNYKEQMYSL